MQRPTVKGLIFFITLALWRTPVLGELPNTHLRLSYQSKWAASESQPLLGLQHQTLFELTPKSSLALRGSWQAPLTGYEGVKIPLLDIAGYQTVLSEARPIDLGIAIMAMDLDRWHQDGRVIRFPFRCRWHTLVLDTVQTSILVSPYAQWNEYSQSTAGRPLPQMGLMERLEIAWNPHPWSMQIHLLIEQAHALRWKNDFGVSERLGVYLIKNWLFGIGHLFTGSVVDESTGLFRNLGLQDGANHVWSLVVEGVI